MATLKTNLIEPEGATTTLTVGEAGGDLVIGADSIKANLLKEDASFSRETFTATGTWTCPVGVSSIEYLVVAGGGGGGSGGSSSYTGGGGGAGGYKTSTVSVSAGTTYTMTVGAGGAASSVGTDDGTNGVDSSISGSGLSTITATGGGRGSTITGSPGGSGGQVGGSGGGGGYSAGGAGTAGQGYAGGAGDTSYPPGSGGGGGGASAVGGDSNGSAGAGGAGITSTLTGSIVTYAGGGGGGEGTGGGGAGAGGAGGGGTGGNKDTTNSVAGTPNTGGGGGGGGRAQAGKSGGSGVIVIKYSGGSGIAFQSNGSGVVSNVNAEWGGAQVLLSSQTVSAQTSISFISGLDSTYDEYVFEFININPANDSTELRLNASTDGGSSYGITKTTTFFRAYNYENDTGAALGYDGGSDLAQSTSPQILVTNIHNAADATACGELHLFNPSSTTYVKNFYSQISNMIHWPGNDNVFVAGYLNTTSAIDAVKFDVDSGTFDGTIKMYGIK